MPFLSIVDAAELIISIDNPPVNGTVIAMLFNSSNTFLDLRDPVKVINLPSGGTTLGRIPDLASGEYLPGSSLFQVGSLKSSFPAMR